MNEHGPSLLSLLKHPPGTWEARKAASWACALGLGQSLSKEAWAQLEHASLNDQKDSRGYHAWHYWAYHGQSLDNGERLFKNWKKLTRSMKESSASSFLYSIDGEHPWHLLCLEGHSHMSSKALEWWGPMNEVLPSHQGLSLAHAMAWSGHAGWLDASFHELWQNTVAPDALGLTPLMIAVHRGGRDYIQALLSLGLDPNEADHHGKTALHHAALYGEPEMFNLLLDANGDPLIKDHQGLSAKHVFKMRQGHVQDKDIASLKEYWARRRLMCFRFI